MQHGKIKAYDYTATILEKYMADAVDEDRILDWQENERPSFPELDVMGVRIEDDKGDCQSSLSTANELVIRIEYLIKHPIKSLRVGISLCTVDDIEIFSSSDYEFAQGIRLRSPGQYTSLCYIPKNFLNVGTYILKVHFDVPGIKNFIVDIPVRFSITEIMHNQLGPTLAMKPGGMIHPHLHWDILHTDVKERLLS